MRILPRFNCPECGEFGYHWIAYIGLAIGYIGFFNLVYNMLKDGGVL